MVMGGDSRSEGCGFKSQCRILDGHFSNCIDVCLKKTENKRKKRPGWHIFKKPLSV